MASPKKRKPAARKAVTSRGLVRESTYLHRDEEEALVAYAERRQISKAEVLRRALRAFLGVED
jgi:hypothetical protein